MNCLEFSHLEHVARVSLTVEGTDCVSFSSVSLGLHPPPWPPWGAIYWAHGQMGNPVMLTDNGLAGRPPGSRPLFGEEAGRARLGVSRCRSFLIIPYGKF